MVAAQLAIRTAEIYTCAFAPDGARVHSPVLKATRFDSGYWDRPLCASIRAYRPRLGLGVGQ